MEDEAIQASDTSHMRQVWNRMQCFPHIFEIADARGELDNYDLQGHYVKAHSPDIAQLRAIQDDGWEVHLADLYDFTHSGILSLAMYHLIANRIQKYVLPDIVLHSPFVLHGPNALVTAQILQFRKHKAKHSWSRIYPYRNMSRQWSLFMVTCLETDHQPQYTIHALLPHGADHAAFDWAKGHIVNAFGSDNVHIDEYSAAHNADSLIFVHLVAWVRSRSSCTQHTVLHTWLQHVVHTCEKRFEQQRNSRKATLPLYAAKTINFSRQSANWHRLF